MKNNTKQENISSLFSLNENLWYRNKSVHLISRGAMRPWVCRKCDVQLLVLLPDQRQVRDFFADSENLKLQESFLVLPEVPFIEDKAKIQAIRVSRGGILDRFRQNKGVLLATPASLLAPFSFADAWLQFSLKDEIGRDNLINWLSDNKYERNDLVWSPGQFVVRGSIVDVFSPSDDYPVRIEFFDNEIVSIRFFLPETQKSLKTLQEHSIQSLIPTTNILNLEKHFLPEMHVVFFDPKGLENTAANAQWLWNNLDNALQSAIPWLEWDDLYKILSKYKRIRVVQDVYTSSYRMSIKRLPMFRGKLKDLEVFTSSLSKEKYSISVYSESDVNLEWAANAGYNFFKGDLSEGFIDPVEKIALISDYELSGITVSARGNSNRAPSDWGAGLIPGQWVTHDDYGVARYLGPKIVATELGDQEYLVLEFAEQRRLLIPVLYFYKISPWTALPGQEPVANSLKSTRWKKTSEKARELAEKAAKDLIKIYATRELTKGYAFSANLELMKEIEKSFIYTETNDQIKAINDVEADMSAAVPMDRLIVGDVGFGKTEVAIRAVSRAVFSGKQVVIMVPTTLLAQQHFETFSTRFANLPVCVEVISRFVSVAEQKRIVNNLENGRVDIIIGTHRLLSPDVIFKDLGLVIIDEEHRFGVLHKESLKKLAPNVDVLMLSATPIPRSLSLSISGLRDISVLQTPPQRRLPVITIVRPWSEELLISAVFREKNRGGQVFFVHNRINDIQERATMLRRLFPKLKIAIAHSRTPEITLEKTMLDFSAGEIDILVCTTIVESGLDIPKANTLIIDDTHELGLAQIYQLRGRVGRREEQAYAFLFYPEDACLSVDARERLEAIAELDELGAGYQLAQRDLQIRGAGDLIGVAQHGNSIKVGYQKYCDLLAAEIAKIKGTELVPVEVQILFPAIIPSDYLPQENQRVTLYRRLLKVMSPNEVIDLQNETEDRFGQIPESLKFLFNLAYVRCSANDFGITKIMCTPDETVITGDCEGSWRTLNLTKKWHRRLDGLLTVGGFDGILSLSEIIKEQYKVSLLK
ncbi:MAG: DEAD/DEAH box helicase [Synergistaceae bacterium]|nr:DEAD/DEAH box helicase [Synergistaceae bacterium]